MTTFKVQTVLTDDLTDRSCTCHFSVTPVGESFHVNLDDVTGEFANDVDDGVIESERQDIDNAICRGGVLVISDIKG